MNGSLSRADLARRRLVATGLHGTAPAAADAVRSLLAVQAQDFGPALWSLGQRTGATEADLRAVLDDGGLIRTHVLRPTWHLVLPEDLRWLLSLTGPRVEVKNAYYCRREGIDDRVRGRFRRALSAALEDGEPRTRAELAEILGRDGFELGGVAGSLLLMHAEQQALVCSGPVRGKHQTYVLFDARVPPSSPRERDDMLAELVRRYLAGHGPATVADIAWWSSLTVADIRRGCDVLGDAVSVVEADGEDHLALDDDVPDAPRPGPQVLLVQAYDEYIVGYADRRYREHPDSPATAAHQGSQHIVLLDGRVVGRWRRTTTTKAVRIRVALDVALDAGATAELHEAAEQYAAHLGLAPEVTVT